MQGDIPPELGFPLAAESWAGLSSIIKSKTINSVH